MTRSLKQTLIARVLGEAQDMIFAIEAASGALLAAEAAAAALNAHLPGAGFKPLATPHSQSVSIALVNNFLAPLDLELVEAALHEAKLDFVRDRNAHPGYGSVATVCYTLKGLPFQLLVEPAVAASAAGLALAA